MTEYRVDAPVDPIERASEVLGASSRFMPDQIQKSRLNEASALVQELLADKPYDAEAHYFGARLNEAVVNLETRSLHEGGHIDELTTKLYWMRSSFEDAYDATFDLDHLHVSPGNTNPGTLYERVITGAASQEEAQHLVMRHDSARGYLRASVMLVQLYEQSEKASEAKKVVDEATSFIDQMYSDNPKLHASTISAIERYEAFFAEKQAEETEKNDEGQKKLSRNPHMAFIVVDSSFGHRVH